MRYTRKLSGARRSIAAVALLAMIGAACSSTDAANVSDEPDASIAPADADSGSGSDSDTGDSGSAVDEPTDEPADEPADGFLFTAPTGDYVITFPGEPTATPLPIPLPTGQVAAEAFIYEDRDAAYFTSVFDYPDGTLDTDPEVVLIDARDGAIANVGGALLDSEFVERDGVPGLAFTFEVADGSNEGEGNALVFVDGLRLYQSFALGFSGQAAQFQAFIDTFMFTDDQAGDS